MAAGVIILGDKALSRKLDRLQRSSSKKAIVAGIRAGMTPIARAMRTAINATSASADLKREARKSIGKRFAKNKMGKRAGIREAKVGFAVGKRKRGYKSTGGGKSGGVGVSAANIHWFVLGTDEREHASGHPTGRIANVFGKVTRLAMAAAAGASNNAARRKIQQVILREARKKG